MLNFYKNASFETLPAYSSKFVSNNPYTKLIYFKSYSQIISFILFVSFVRLWENRINLNLYQKQFYIFFYVNLLETINKEHKDFWKSNPTKKLVFPAISKGFLIIVLLSSPPNLKNTEVRVPIP